MRYPSVTRQTHVGRHVKWPLKLETKNAETTFRKSDSRVSSCARTEGTKKIYYPQEGCETVAEVMKLTPPTRIFIQLKLPD